MRQARSRPRFAQVAPPGPVARKPGRIRSRSSPVPAAVPAAMPARLAAEQVARAAAPRRDRERARPRRALAAPPPQPAWAQHGGRLQQAAAVEAGIWARPATGLTDRRTAQRTSRARAIGTLRRSRPGTDKRHSTSPGGRAISQGTTSHDSDRTPTRRRHCVESHRSRVPAGSDQPSSAEYPTPRRHARTARLQAPPRCTPWQSRTKTVEHDATAFE